MNWRWLLIGTSDEALFDSADTAFCGWRLREVFLLSLAANLNDSKRSRDRVSGNMDQGKGEERLERMVLAVSSEAEGRYSPSSRECREQEHAFSKRLLASQAGIFGLSS